MKRKKIAIGILFVFLTFSLTGCPHYREGWQGATKQGTIHELGIVDDSFGIFLESGNTRITDDGVTIYQDGNTLRDHKIQVESLYQIYNNLTERVVRLALPMTRSICVSDPATLSKISLKVNDRDGTHTYEPTLAYGNWFSHYHAYESNSFSDILSEVENKQKNSLPALYRYEGEWLAEGLDLSFAWELDENTSAPIFFFETGIEGIINNLGTYKLKPQVGKRHFEFYSTYDLRTIWKDLPLTMTEVSFQMDFIESLALQIGLNRELTTSYIQSLVNWEDEQVGYYQIANIISNYFSSSSTYLQNYMLFYEVPILGNNQATVLKIQYETKVEVSQYGHEIAHSLQGLKTFLNVYSYQCHYVFLNEKMTMKSINTGNSTLSWKKEDDSFVTMIDEEDSIDDCYVIFTLQETKNTSGCTAFRLSIRLSFGGIFVFLFILIELSYRRKKYVK